MCHVAYFTKVSPLKCVLHDPRGTADLSKQNSHSSPGVRLRGPRTTWRVKGAASLPNRTHLWATLSTQTGQRHPKTVLEKCGVSSQSLGARTQIFRGICRQDPVLHLLCQTG